VSAGYVTESQLKSDPTFFVSDDPIDASAYIVTIKVLGPEQSLPNIPQGTHVFSTVSYAVVESKASQEDLADGVAPW
jgi:hypothetical protein